MKFSIPNHFALIAVAMSFGCTEDISSVPEKSEQKLKQSADLDRDLAMEFLIEQQLEFERRKLLKGVHQCEGYLSNNVIEEFCVSEVPEDWTPFEFNNETYYVQPLSVRSD